MQGADRARSLDLQSPWCWRQVERLIKDDREKDCSVNHTAGVTGDLVRNPKKNIKSTRWDAFWSIRATGSNRWVGSWLSCSPWLQFLHGSFDRVGQQTGQYLVVAGPSDNLEIERGNLVDDR